MEKVVHKFQNFVTGNNTAIARENNTVIIINVLIILSIIFLLATVVLCLKHLDQQRKTEIDCEKDSSIESVASSTSNTSSFSEYSRF